MMNKYYDNNYNEYEVMVTGIMKVFPVSLIFFYICFLMFDIIVMMKISPDSCSTWPEISL